MHHGDQGNNLEAPFPWPGANPKIWQPSPSMFHYRGDIYTDNLHLPGHRTYSRQKLEFY